jgi:peptidoglycan-associated lipoprotein
MLNKKLLLLLATLAVASCSANKKSANAENNSFVAKEPKVVVQEEKLSEVEEDEMFSVSADEIKKSESGPHVVYFDTNSSNLNVEAVATLTQKVLSEAKSAKTKKVVIEAHCDERGSKAYNQKLSKRRAKAVKDYLVKNGVEVKIKTVGYGESKPVALGHDEESWAKNRRAITISIKK